MSFLGGKKSFILQFSKAVFKSATLTFYGFLWASLHANELCLERTLHFTGDPHTHASTNKTKTIVNLSENISSVWITQIFTHTFTKILMNEVHFWYLHSVMFRELMYSYSVTTLDCGSVLIKKKKAERKQWLDWCLCDCMS